MDITEQCIICNKLIHTKSHHLKHFHFSNNGEKVICIECFKDLRGMTDSGAKLIWRLGRAFVPQKHLTNYNSKLPIYYEAMIAWKLSTKKK